MANYSIHIEGASPDDLSMILSLAELVTAGARATLPAQSAYDALDWLFTQAQKFLLARLADEELDAAGWFAQSDLFETYQELMQGWQEGLKRRSGLVVSLADSREKTVDDE